MKKAILFVYLIGIAAFYGYSQSFTLSDSTGAVANNSTVVFTGLPSDDLISSYVFVTNISSSAKDVRVKKVEIDLVDGSANTFCWGLCYSPNIYVSLDTQNIAAGGTNYFDFVGDYMPQTVSGISVIRYVFFDDHNTSDTVCFNVEYHAFPLGVENVHKGTQSIAAYPNPANAVLNFEYNVSGIDSKIVVRNLLGSTVKEVAIGNSGDRKSTISVADLSNGVYFYSLVEGGQVLTTKKFIVKH
jgi:hypothetical protein